MVRRGAEVSLSQAGSGSSHGHTLSASLPWDQCLILSLLKPFFAVILSSQSYDLLSGRICHM